MNRSKFITTGAIVCSLLAAVSVLYFTVYRNKDLDSNNEERITVPEFDLPGAEGNLVTLDDFDADIRIVSFWASWSPYSSEELKMLQRVQEEYGEDVAVIALNRDHVTDDGKRFLLQEGIPESKMFVYDKDDEYFKKIEGYAVPETLFIDEDDNLVYQQHGPITYEEVKEIIESIKHD